MRKIKIFQLMHGYHGLLGLCNEYSQAFNNPRFEVTVGYLAGSPREDVRAATVADRVVFFEFTSKDIRGAKISAVRKVLTLCRSERFDVVFCHRYKPTYVMSLVNLFCPIPKLFSVVHGLGELRRLSRKLHVSLFCRNRWKFIGISNAVSRDLCGSRCGLDGNNVVTIQNAIDVTATVAQQVDFSSAREILGVSSQDFVFGTVGRLSLDKDQITIIQAFSQARNEMPGAKVVIVGGGRLDELLRSEAERLSVDGDTVFVGHVPQAFRLMRGFDVFLLPSFREGFGIVLLEAMAARLPIIATTVGGIPEVVGSEAFLVSPRNPVALSEKMIEFYRMSASARQARGDAGYARLKEQFTHETHHAKVLRLVECDRN